MVRMRRGFLVFALAGLGSASVAFAQNVTSGINGVAKDAQGAVLPGVTVTATSPALIGSQVVTTEANGTYRFPALPPGSYTISFVLSGFQPFKRPGIVLALNQTLTVDATLQLASLQES